MVGEGSEDFNAKTGGEAEEDGVKIIRPERAVEEGMERWSAARVTAEVVVGM